MSSANVIKVECRWCCSAAARGCVEKRKALLLSHIINNQNLVRTTLIPYCSISVRLAPPLFYYRKLFLIYILHCSYRQQSIMWFNGGMIMIFHINNTTTLYMGTQIEHNIKHNSTKSSEWKRMYSRQLKSRSHETTQKLTLSWINRSHSDAGSYSDLIIRRVIVWRIIGWIRLSYVECSSRMAVPNIASKKHMTCVTIN